MHAGESLFLNPHYSFLISVLMKPDCTAISDLDHDTFNSGSDDNEPGVIHNTAPTHGVPDLVERARQKQAKTDHQEAQTEHRRHNA